MCREKLCIYIKIYIWSYEISFQLLLIQLRSSLQLQAIPTKARLRYKGTFLVRHITHLSSTQPAGIRVTLLVLCWPTDRISTTPELSQLCGKQNNRRTVQEWVNSSLTQYSSLPVDIQLLNTDYFRKTNQWTTKHNQLLSQTQFSYMSVEKVYTCNLDNKVLCLLTSVHTTVLVLMMALRSGQTTSTLTVLDWICRAVNRHKFVIWS